MKTIASMAAVVIVSGVFALACGESKTPNDLNGKVAETAEVTPSPAMRDGGSLNDPKQEPSKSATVNPSPNPSK